MRSRSRAKLLMALRFLEHGGMSAPRGILHVNEDGAVCALWRIAAWFVIFHLYRVALVGI